MAEVNVLKSSYTGSLGDTTGTKWKDKNIVKAKIFSKAPPTENQTKNVRAFEALNRVAGVLAREYWNVLGLSDKKMLKHNAVAKWLKPAIKNHVFEPQNFAESIPADGDLKILSFAIDRSTNICTVIVDFADDYIPTTGTIAIIMCIDNEGHPIFDWFFEPIATQNTFYMPYGYERKYYLFGFLCDPTHKGWKVHGFDIIQGVKMQYSLNEQPTGELWLDGSLIYRKTVEIPLDDLHNYRVIEGQLLDFIPSIIIKYEIHAPSSYVTENCTVPGTYYYDSNSFSSVNPRFYIDGETMDYLISIGNETPIQPGENNVIYMTVWYTKS